MTAATPSLSCPSCADPSVRVFHTAREVPVNSVLLLPTREEALGFPTGDIQLGFCPGCGFVYNTTFQAELLEYSARYEETQGFSPTFQRWHRDLAERLVERYQLRDKDLIEIGCGTKGEFLALLCELGPNRGVGFDPAYLPERNESDSNDDLRFVQDFYSEKYADTPGEFVVCKMTLEHISPTAEFVGTVRRALQAKPEATVFFQVPDVLRILQQGAFWDIYYEHCSYFSVGSLTRLFRKAGFQVLEASREYDAQYLTIVARPGGGPPRAPLPLEDDLAQLTALVDRFAQDLPAQLDTWRKRLLSSHEAGRRVVIWGAGSKGVAFLTTVGVSEAIEYAVDINPHKQGCYMASTGQEIVSPQFLEGYRPDLVVVMNPIYRDEIVASLAERGLSPEILTT